jgi:hypothetical protein
LLLLRSSDPKQEKNAKAFFALLRVLKPEGVGFRLPQLEEVSDLSETGTGEEPPALRPAEGIQAPSVWTFL